MLTLIYQRSRKNISQLSDYNEFTNEILDAKIKEKRLVNRSSISNLVKNFDLKKKLKTLVTNAELITEPEKIVKFQVSY